jgi:hypothetical protein
MKTIFSEVLEIKQAYEQDTIELIDGLEYSQAKTLKMIEFYSNSKYLNSQKDELGREKPFFNILNANVDVAEVATDLDTKDIQLIATSPESYGQSFLLGHEVKNWMRETNFAKTLNDMAKTRPRYGGVLVKKCELGGKLMVEVVRWKNVITDQVDIKKGPIIEKHWLTPVQLEEKRGAWDDKAINEAIVLCKKKSKDSPRGNVLVYEVEGIFPKEYIDEGDGYSLQSHYLIADGKHEITLYSEELKESRYKYLPWEEVPGRALGRGIIEKGEEAQVWVNDSIIAEKNAMELAGKSIVQTASKRYSGRNILTELENGSILEHEDGKPFTRVELTPSSLPVWQNLVQRWQSQFDRSTSVTDALRGETPPSGQAFRLQAMVTNQSASQFDHKREEFGIFIREIFMDWVIPYLIKKLKKAHTLVSEFSQNELQRIDEAYVNSLIKTELEKSIKLGEIVDPMQIEKAKMEALNKLATTGSHRYLDVPEGFYDNIKVKVDIVTTGEQQNKQATLESLSNIFQIVASNPSILQDPVLSEIFYTILETSGAGLSPVSLSAKARKAPMLTQGQAPRGVEVPQADVNQSSLPDPNQVGTQAQLSEM